MILWYYSVLCGPIFKNILDSTFENAFYPNLASEKKRAATCLQRALALKCKLSKVVTVYFCDNRDHIDYIL